MAEFLKLISPADALAKFLPLIPPPGSERIQTINTLDAFGLVNAADIRAREPSPPFTRSTHDGYAVRSKDTNGASDSLPLYLKVVGEILMGRNSGISLGEGEAALIHTGGMLPENADSVIMLEDIQISREGEIEIHRSTAHNENTIQKGEDVARGDLILPKGKRIRAAEIGGLLSQGITSIQVFQIPTVGIISSGDEVVTPAAEIQDGQIRDINSHMLACLVARFGGRPVNYGIAADKIESLAALAQKAYNENDAVLITAGSSVSARDITARVIEELGKPGIIVHGVNIKPGKPTIFALCGQKPVIGLPGNPVSAYVIASILFAPVIDKLSGLEKEEFKNIIQAEITLNYPSVAGRVDYVPVKLTKENRGYRAEPIFFKSNMIFSLVQADGLAVIPADATGVSAGEIVDILLI